MTTIKKETYVEADEKTRHALTYDMLMGLHEKYDHQVQHCEVRFGKLENHKKRDTVFSGLLGFVGGFVAMAAYWLKERF